MESIKASHEVQMRELWRKIESLNSLKKSGEHLPTEAMPESPEFQSLASDWRATAVGINSNNNSNLTHPLSIDISNSMSAFDQHRMMPRGECEVLNILFNF